MLTITPSPIHTSTTTGAGPTQPVAIHLMLSVADPDGVPCE